MRAVREGIFRCSTAPFDEDNAARKSVAVSLSGQSFANLVGIQDSQPTPHFFPLAIEEYEGRGVLKPVPLLKNLDGRISHVEVDYMQVTPKFPLDPIHDGSTRKTGQSIIALKFEKDRCTGANFLLYVGQVCVR